MCGGTLPPTDTAVQSERVTHEGDSSQVADHTNGQTLVSSAMRPADKGWAEREPDDACWARRRANSGASSWGKRAYRLDWRSWRPLAPWAAVRMITRRGG